VEKVEEVRRVERQEKLVRVTRLKGWCCNNSPCFI
jgi:hypothetical protein